MTTIAPNAAWRPIPENYGGAMSRSLGLILHVQAGNNSPHGWFSRPATDASSHWWVSSDGQLEQYVDAGRASWAQAGGNTTYHSVETEGWPHEPLTAAQEATLARLYRWGHERYGWPYELAERPGEHGFGWHGMGGTGWGNHPSCPGGLRKGRRSAILKLAEGNVAAAAAVPKPKTPAWPKSIRYISLTRHSRHPAVRTWQARMRDRGWRIPVNGIFDADSVRVLNQFKAQLRLPQDGRLGPRAWRGAWQAPITKD